jgi:hypothetical protein
VHVRPSSLIFCYPRSHLFLHHFHPLPAGLSLWLHNLPAREIGDRPARSLPASACHTFFDSTCPAFAQPCADPRHARYLLASSTSRAAAAQVHTHKKHASLRRGSSAIHAACSRVVRCYSRGRNTSCGYLPASPCHRVASTAEEAAATTDCYHAVRRDTRRCLSASAQALSLCSPADSVTCRELCIRESAQQNWGVKICGSCEV